MQALSARSRSVKGKAAIAPSTSRRYNDRAAAQGRAARHGLEGWCWDCRRDLTGLHLGASNGGGAKPMFRPVPSASLLIKRPL